MNKELNRKKLHEILDIVLDGNGFDPRRRDKSGALPTVFMYFSGHVGVMTVNIYNNGWQPGSSYDEELDFRLNDDISDESIQYLRNTVSEALTDKTEEDILAHDIANAEKEIQNQRERLMSMKKRLRKMQQGDNQ